MSDQPKNEEPLIMFETITAPDLATEDDQYRRFLLAIRIQFNSVTGEGRRLFPTDAANLFAAFLDALPVERRKHYACNACKQFLERFGGLVAVSGDGTASPAMWDPDTVPPFFQPSVRAVARLVSRAKITGVFLSEERTWGLWSNTSKSAPGVWYHMAVTPDPTLVHKPSQILSTSQVVAEKLQDYGTLCRGLTEFPLEVAQQAHTLLTTGTLYRSEKCIGVARWFLDLHEARRATKNATARDNLTWLAVATAPAGFCHVKSSMIGTLLEDIQSGMAFEQIKWRFDEKLNPLQYQRPQAAPSAGNLAQAERIVATLRTAGALDRRFAKLEEIQALWTPKAARPEPSNGGVFGHLKIKHAGSPLSPITQPPVLMTWEKFRRTILPEADRIEFYVPTGAAPYAALVTAANHDSPPILQWDREDKRNQVSWYLYHGGSPPNAWNLPTATYQPVTAVTLQPTMWDDEDEYSHHGQGVLFLLDGCRDMRKDGEKDTGGGFFPECLRSEYHGVCATMEAYAKSAVIAGGKEATACGIKLQKAGSAWNYQFRVTTNGVQVTYKLDRWD